MAKSKSLVDYLENDIDVILREEYRDIQLKDIQKETDLPLWLLKDLNEYGYIDIQNNNKESSLILKTLMYCHKNHRFLKSAVGNLSSKDKERLFKKKDDTKLRTWIKTKVFNLKNKGYSVQVKDIYREICVYFPSIEEQGWKGYKDIRRYINNAKRSYLRDKKYDMKEKKCHKKRCDNRVYI